ncbi:MAG: DMT family transporter [Actinomycetota bacterium]
MEKEFPPAVWLTLGVVAASLSAILIRYADDAEPLAISFWRCAAGAALLAPFAAPKLRAVERRSLVLPAVAGAWLAVHFGTWITSLELTTVASSVLLVSTTPIFVALAAWALFNERLPSLGWFGIALALAGTAMIGGGDLEDSSLSGDLLALAGGAAAGGYVLSGQIARRHLGILEYAVVTYSLAAVMLGLACLIGDVPLWGYGGKTWWAIAGIVAGPQLLGHTLINFVLRDIDATTVSVAIMAEPVIATALAYWLFEETPTWWAYPGGAAILAGIYAVARVARTPAVVVE